MFGKVPSSDHCWWTGYPDWDF